MGRLRHRHTQVLLEREACLTQALQDLEVLGHGKELADGCRDLGPDALARRDVLLGCGRQCIDGQEALRQDLGDRLAHMADAQREQHTGEWLRLGTDELVHHLAGDGVTDLDGIARGHALLLVVLGVGAARVEALTVSQIGRAD